MTHHAGACRTVVVTGTSGGIGRTCVTAFGARGDRLALIVRGPGGLDGACAKPDEPAPRE
ncbi:MULTISPECIES: hypothetical protein [unclassified Streptomyces]|uniref:Short-chain dehydrogenase n=1 Tax=Streptomyces sp. NBC_00119 TaxID=2975659 RepID=A0AAU1UKK6_9ACTN|nr:MULTISPECIES: hypothetical protein [unclassified Streptomyces]MCX4649875.1 hypothetical protein [Streptomyces sp. NBC_01446]MCX5320912.1 hypothetical protein [Streptomyces sp. NBC_00120]